MRLFVRPDFIEGDTRANGVCCSIFHGPSSQKMGDNEVFDEVESLATTARFVILEICGCQGNELRAGGIDPK